MKFCSLLRRVLTGTLAVVSLASALCAAEDRAYKTTPILAREASTLVRLLEEVHYNREGVKPADYSNLIPDYLAELDGPRLFFLQTDKAEFAKQYPTDWLYNNISSLGKIDAAYEIFSVYEKRARERIAWIQEELKKDVDLTSNDSYPVDRSKAEWPATKVEADDLWRKRLKFEILQEVLNKKTIEQARENVGKRYDRLLKNLTEIESNEISEMFLSSIARMYDPHSTYFSADTYEDFGIQMRLQLVGIGALLSVEEDYCVIKEIITGGPADLGKKLRPNDKIIAVGQVVGEPVEVIGMKLRKIVDLIRGPKGTPVKLIVQPADASDPSVREEIVLTRDVVNLDSARARAAIFQVPDAAGRNVPIGVITLPAFYGPDSNSDGEARNSATRDVAELVRRLTETGIEGLVLDLRHNGGGLLSEAIELAGLFIKQGPVVQVKSHYGDVKVDTDDDPTIAYTGPLAVLVSKLSASASEIVAGTLQNYGRAIVVGDSSTHGKGSVQTIIEMKNVVPALARTPAKTGATKLTIQKFYLPDGHSTQLKGVVPDIVLPSLDDLLPVGEKDLPHALIWDEIPSTSFDGKPLDPAVLNTLAQASKARQESLDEFGYLKKQIDWFKSKQDQKLVSLNLEERQKQKEIDQGFRKEIESEKAQLAKNDYTFQEFNLGPPKPPRIKAEKKPESTEDEIELATEQPDTYGKLDIQLREAMRILNDAIEIGRKPELWASDHAPLTARITKRS